VPTRIFPLTHQRSRSGRESKRVSPRGIGFQSIGGRGRRCYDPRQTRFMYRGRFSIAPNRDRTYFRRAGWSSLVARQAHNLKVAGSNPAPATNFLSTAVTYRVYILRNCGGSFYIGLSEDVERRVEQHNTGQSRWTKGRGPWAIAWQSEELSLTDARKLENRLKRQKGSHGLFHLVGVRRSAGS
jgi:putative endonuclease